MCHNLVADKFDNIFHIFPIIGHTMLPCDSDFGNIEKHIRSHGQAVYTRDQWAEEIIKSRRSKPFTITKTITI